MPLKSILSNSHKSKQGRILTNFIHLRLGNINFATEPMWASYPANPNSSIVEVDFQNDGNLVAYDVNHNAIWSSSTNGKGATLEFQGDGNMFSTIVTITHCGQPEILTK